MIYTKNYIEMRENMSQNETEKEFILQKKSPDDKVIALAGNPNVGKSTVFNALTGLKQHTGNWSGKTIANAQGYCVYRDQRYLFVDIPGCYSLMAHSTEEEVARDFICFSHPDAVVVVCDATCLERNMTLVLQILEVEPKTVVCVNLMDEAKKKGLKLDLTLLQQRLGVPVIGISARSKTGLDQIFNGLQIIWEKDSQSITTIHIDYEKEVEELISAIETILIEEFPDLANTRWLSLRLLDAEPEFLASIFRNLCENSRNKEKEISIFNKVEKEVAQRKLNIRQIQDSIAYTNGQKASELLDGVVIGLEREYNWKDRYFDWIFTSKWLGFPIMFLLLLGIFWITMIGANYPSEILAKGLFFLEDRLEECFLWMGLPNLFIEALVHGIYRVVAWVVSVMLPPMAIFFPLFTILEDFGYLPRVAFNLDRCFHCCKACGKQALTMMMDVGNL